MKRIAAMFLLVAMCFLLGACGSKVDIKEAVLGDWTNDVFVDTRSPEERANPDSIEEGYFITYTLSFYKGGTFNLKGFNPEAGYAINQMNGTWEIVDGVVVITSKSLLESGAYSLAIDTESNPYILTWLDSNMVYTKVM